MTVYPVMGLVFLVDLLLLLGAGRLWRELPEVWGCFAGAAVGALHTAACLIPGFHFLGSIFWRIVFAGLTGFLAYGGNWRQLIRFVLLFLGVNLLTEAVTRENLSATVLAAAGLWLLCGSALSGRNYVPLELWREGKHLSLTALRDTGNTLRDPVSGEQVLVLSPEASFALTGLTAQQLRTPLDTLLRRPIPGLKLIPYQTVGSTGFLLGLRFPEAKIAGRRRAIVAAFAPEGPGRGEAYQALAGGYL